MIVFNKFQGIWVTGCNLISSQVNSLFCQKYYIIFVTIIHLLFFITAEFRPLSLQSVKHHGVNTIHNFNFLK